MHVDADVPLVGHERLTRVHSHPHANRPRQRGLCIACRCQRLGGAREHDEERVALRVHLHAVVPRESVTQDAAVLGEHLGVLVAQFVQQARRALDVREQEGDGAGGELGHRLMMRRRRRKV